MSVADLFGRLAGLLALRDPRTGLHSRRIGVYAADLARAFGLPPAEVRAIGLAAPLHDVGKLAIPDAILLKPGPLDPLERRQMQRHAQIGHDLLAGSGLPLLELAAEIAFTHHERFDGCGYPSGIAGEAIPLGGRIVAIADAFDCLLSERPYQAPLPAALAGEAMREASGTHFDAALLDLFTTAVLPRFGAPACAPRPSPLPAP